MYPRLLALEPLPKADWLEQARSALLKRGYAVVPLATSLAAWQERRQFGGLHYTDGWSIRRIWLAPGRSALVALPKRIYFDGAGNCMDRRPESEILKGKRPPGRPAADELALEAALLAELQAELEGVSRFVPLKVVASNLGAARRVAVGGQTLAFPPARLNALYREHGFDRVPSQSKISVCAADDCSEDAIESIVRQLSKVAQQRKAAVRVVRTNLSFIEASLAEMRSKERGPVAGKCLLFILPSSERAASPETMGLFRRLEAAGVPFRRAFADDPLEIAAADQFPSLLMAAGGRTHSANAWVKGEQVWTVGIDLGHPRSLAESILVATLVDPSGELKGAWTAQQQRDETVRASSLVRVLQPCGNALAKATHDAAVVVLRDGRLNAGEDANLYGRLLNARVSLFEFRKRGNPQVQWAATKEHTEKTPFAVLVPGTTTLFVSLAAPRNDSCLSAMAKVTWRQKWNALGLEELEIAQLLAASAAAPGLGLSPRHLPAAIYWADGIAGESPIDLRFAGTRRIAV